jgi:hypothetical protein
MHSYAVPPLFSKNQATRQKITNGVLHSRLVLREAPNQRAAMGKRYDKVKTQWPYLLNGQAELCCDTRQILGWSRNPCNVHSVTDGGSIVNIAS